MSEIKRGVPFPTGFPEEEARLIGPYPVFGQWWGSIKNRIPEASQLPEKDLGTLHEFYVLRRLMQKERGKRDKDEVKIEELRGQLGDFWQRVEKSDEKFEKRNSEIIQFIRERTE